MALTRVAGRQITNSTISNADLEEMPQGTIKGRSLSGDGPPENLSVEQTRELLGFGSTTKGSLLSGGNTEVFVGDDGYALEADSSTPSGFMYNANKIRTSKTFTVAAVNSDFVSVYDALEELNKWHLEAGIQIFINVEAGTTVESSLLVGKHVHGSQIVISGAGPAETVLSFNNDMNGITSYHSNVLRIENLTLKGNDQATAITSYDRGVILGRDIICTGWKHGIIAGRGGLVHIPNITINGSTSSNVVSKTKSIISIENAVINLNSTAMYGIHADDFGFVSAKNSTIRVFDSAETIPVCSDNGGEVLISGSTLDAGDTGLDVIQCLNNGKVIAIEANLLNPYRYGVLAVGGSEVNLRNATNTGGNITASYGVMAQDGSKVYVGGSYSTTFWTVADYNMALNSMSADGAIIYR